MNKKEAIMLLVHNKHFDIYTRIIFYFNIITCLEKKYEKCQSWLNFIAPFRTWVKNDIQNLCFFIIFYFSVWIMFYTKSEFYSSY